MSSAAIFDSAIASERRERIVERSWPVISSVVVRPCVPTIVAKNAFGSAIFIAYVPNARRRIIPNSASRIITGFVVPHFRSVKSRMLKK